MKIRIATWWEGLRASYWFVPSLTSLTAMLLSLATTAADRAFHEGDVDLPSWLYSGGPDGARDLVSTLASAMMSVTSLVFSITIVALTLASNQFGPRLLRNFMRDRGSQWTLGVFIATFLYAFLILRTIRAGESEFVPGIGVTTALVLAVLSTGVLIYFIHHISTIIQADQVVQAVHDELCEVIARLLPEEEPVTQPPELPDDFEDNSEALRLGKGEYLQGIDDGDVLRIAEEEDIVVRFLVRPGDFVPQEGTIARIWPAERSSESVAKRLRGAVVLGPHRTPTQDVEYGILQLVEIAVRSLSPGINDPFTAVACIDRLGSALRRLCERPFPPAGRVDAEGRLRVVVDVTDFGGHVGAAFNQIRQNARGSVAVLIRLIEALENIVDAARGEAQLAVLQQHADMVLAAGARDVPEPRDRDALAARHREFLAAVARRRGAR